MNKGGDGVIKLIKMMTLLLISTITFATTNDAKMQKAFDKQKREVREGINGIKKNNSGLVNVIVTGVSNEAAIEEVAKSKTKLKIDEFVLIFPDVRFVDKYIESASRNVVYTVVILMDKKTDEKYLEYRDYESFLELGLDKKIANLPNIEVQVYEIRDEDIKKIIPNSFKNPLEDEIVKKYILR